MKGVIPVAYQVLLVDDEMPALRFVQSIIEKYIPDFEVQATCSSGEKAAEYLRNHAVDVMITDISMQRMNGIELAKLARSLQPYIHMIIISGYAEFEYAQGAIQVSVDDYMLKPVSINQMKQTLTRLKAALDEEHIAHAAAILPAIACELPYSREDIARCWLGQEYRFALVRWGGVHPLRSGKLHATSLIQPFSGSFYALRGRDDNEQILIFPARELEQFMSEISVYMVQHTSLSTWTAIYQPTPQAMVMLHGFVKQALPQLQTQAVIGKHQLLPLCAAADKAAPPTLTAAQLNQLSYFCSCGRFDEIKEMFLEFAVAFERQSYTQRQVWGFVQQLVLGLTASLPALKAHYDKTISGILDLFLYASTYGELMANIYAVLFEDESTSRDRKLSTRELYDFAMDYIDKNYASPLSVQSVCDEIGISQTYLNRLFRKYSDVTFNNCLMRRRMEAAMHLLRDKPGMLLRDVAACVGYEDSSYFSKVFHQHTGQTPSQYAAGQK